MKRSRPTTRRDFVKAASRKVVGIDLFLESPLAPEQLGPSVEKLLAGSAFALKAISSRGTKVYPMTGAITDNPDHYCARLMSTGGEPTDAQVIDALQRVGKEHRWMHVEKLQEIDGEPAFSKSQV